MRHRRGKRARQQGFSLIEAMISAAILGIGLVGLSALHISAIRGTVRSEEIGRAAEVARQIADTFTTIDLASLPVGCGPGPTAQATWINPPDSTGGCKGGPTTFNPPKSPGCTAYYNEDGVPDVTDPTWVSNPMQGNAPAASGKYRVDIALTAHPDTLAYPPASAFPPPPDENSVAVLWVWVCYEGEGNTVNEVLATRVVAANL